MEGVTNVLDLTKVSKISESFIHFLAIAEDMVHRIENHDRDFFEGEKEFESILESFYKQEVISEEDYYDLLGRPYENSIYTILKKLYFDGYFSGDINRVEKIQRILAELAVYIKPVDISEIQSYFRVRYSDLISKETKGNITQFTIHILDVIRNGEEQQETQLIWNFIDIVSKLDSSGYIIKLNGLGNKPALAAHECLHFLLMNNFLSHDSDLQSSTYLILKEYYLRLGVDERIRELNEIRSNIEITPLIPKSITARLERSSSEDIRIIHYIHRESKAIFKNIALGMYDTQTENRFRQFLIFLSSEGVIYPEEFSTAMESIEDVSSVFYIFDGLSKLGCFAEDEAFKKQISQADLAYEEVQTEEDFSTTPTTASLEEIDDTIMNFTKTALVLLEAQSYDKLEVFLNDFIEFLLDNLVFPEEYVESISAKNIQELTYQYILRLKKYGYYRDSPKTEKKVNIFLGQFHNE